MPTTITISEFQPGPGECNFSGTTCKLRRYYDQDWTDVDGVFHAEGNQNSATGFFDEISCTLSGNTITVPAFSATPTDNPQTGINVRETWQLWDQSGSPRNVIFEGFIPSAASPITFGALRLLNFGQTLFESDAPTRLAQWIQSYIDTVVGLLRFATSVIAGWVRLNVPAANVADPIAKGDNDPTLPTTTTAVVHAAQYTGATAGAKMRAAAVALAAFGGGVVDARGIAGGTISENIFASITYPITLLLGIGTYIVTVEQAYATSVNHSQGLRVFGAGMGATIIDNRVANGSAFYLDGSGGGSTFNVFQRNTELRDFQITGSATSPANSAGISLRSNHQVRIDNVWVQDVSSHGFQIVNELQDTDAVANLTMTNCRSISNDGWGFYVGNPVTQTASGNFIFNNCEFVFNGLGGMRAVGQQWTIVGGSITYNTGYGIYAPYNIVGLITQTFGILHVSDTEMDGNTLAHVKLDAGINITFENIKVIQSDTVVPADFNPPIAFIVGDGGAGSLIAPKFQSINIRQDSLTPTTLFQIGSNALYTQINEYVKVGTGTAAITDYTDAGTATNIVQEGKTYGAASTINSTSVTGSYTPNAKIGVHRVVITATGAFTMNAPSVATDGNEIELLITNSSAGAITISFAGGVGGYFTAGYVDPTSTQKTSAKFRYVAAASTWVQVGAWSPPA